MSMAVALGLALLGAVLSSLLRELKSPYAPYVAALAGLLVLGLLFGKWDSLTPLLSFFEKAGLSEATRLVLKVLGVGYLTEIGAEICRELGAESLASRLSLLGRMEIFLLSLPALEKLFTAAVEMLG